MGGKTSTSTSAVSIPPEVLARYNSVNANAEQVAQTPFQQYSTNPNAFVAPITPTQSAGIQNTNSAAGMAQPYFQAGTGFALAGAQPVNANPLDTSTYMNPYLNTVLGSTEALINQQNQQAMSGQTGNAMSQGYFGGDRAGIAAAVLAGQQQLAAGQTYSGIASDAYNQALAAAQQQQGVNLAAQQANRAALQQTGQSLAELGTGAQGAALSGAQAQLGAGQVEQQTQQAGLTALYNQFLQQQSYPFQTAQFLANIAEGTGALSGSTTTTTQPQSIFSDERLKEDMVPVGVGFDGANIYRFRYRGDPTTHIGFSAQEVAQTHPEAVSVHPSGFLMVDYGKATDDAAGFALAANDNFWPEQEPRRARAAGGRVERQAGGMSGWGLYPSGSNPMVIQQLLESQAQMYGPYSGEGGPGLYGHSASQIPHGGQGYVPAASLPVGQLQVARPVAAPQQGGLGSDIHEAASLADDAEGLSKDYHFAHEGFDKLRSFFGGGGDGGGNMTGPPNANGGRVGRQGGGGLGDFWTALSSGSAADRAAANRRLLAHQQAVRAAQAQQRAAAAAAAKAPPVHQPSGFESSGRPPAPGSLNFGGGNPSAGRWGTLGQLADWAANADWIGTPDQVARSRAWNAAHGAAAPAPATGNTYRGAPLVGTPAAAPTPGGGHPDLLARTAQLTGDPGLARAAAIQHHVQQSHAHAQAAQDLINPSQVPTAAPTGQASPNLAGEAGIGLPTNTGAPVIPINVGDTSHLQGGFAPANLQPYHEGLFQRLGDWLGGHFGSDAQRMAYDARGMNTTPPIQSYDFQGRAPVSADQGLTHDQWLAGASPAAAPVAVAQAPPASTEPIQSAAFDPAAHPVAIRRDVDENPTLTAAYGGFARAAGGVARPSGAEVSGAHNTDRVARDLGGGTDPSNPQDDNPYKPQGPGLNIPTAETQHAKLATATPPSQGGGGGLGSAIGMGSDLVNIAKFALPFFGVPVRTGGRIGYAGAGAVGDGSDDDTPTTPAPAVHDATATPAAAAADDDSAAPPRQPGLGGADQSGGGHGGGFGGMLRNLIGAPAHLLGEAVGYQGDGHFDRDRLMPFLSMIGAIGATPTVHPLFALSQGLGAYANSYMAQQQKEQQLNLTAAQAAREQYEAEPEAIRNYVGTAPGFAMTPDGRGIDRSRSFQSGDGRWHHYITADEMIGGAGGAPAGQTGTAASTMVSQQGPHGAAGAPATGPVQADYSGGGAPRYTLGPSSQEIARAGHLYGVDPNASGIQNRVRRQTGNVQVTDDQIAAAGKTADMFDGSLNDASSTHRALVDTVNQIEKLQETGPGAVGPGQEERQLALSSYNMMLRMFGLQGDSSIDDNTATTQILQKLSALQGAASAGQYGQHAASIANQLSSVMPSGHIQKAAAYNLLSQMLVTNQQDRDFANYRAQYQRLGLGDFQALEAFHRDFDPMYAQEAKQLQSMMARGPKGGPSVFEVLQQRPQDIQRFEQGWDKADGSRQNGFGYLGRYLN